MYEEATRSKQETHSPVSEINLSCPHEVSWGHVAQTWRRCIDGRSPPLDLHSVAVFFSPFLDKPLNVAGKLFSIVDLTELPKAVLLGSFSATMF